MKKFFSLLCATLLVFSASAAPVAKKAELAKQAPVAVEQMQKVQFEQAQIANFDQLSATPELKVNNFKPQALAKAPQATQAEPIVVIIDGTPSIQPAGDVQAITVIGKDNMVYAWGVKTTSLESGKTYTFADMSTDYTYRCSQDYFTTWEDPTDATFSIDAEKNITASMVTVSGTYMVYTNDPTPPQPSYDTIPVTVAAYQAKYYASSLDWQVIMQDAAGNGYSFDIFAPAEGLENGKTYTSDNGDFDLDYTFAQVNKVNDAAVKASFTKTETEDALTVTAEMTTAANHVYQFTYNVDKTIEIVDANGIIIQPAKGETKEYNRLATNTCFYNNSGTKLGYQSGTATLVECADGTVYWQNPVSKYTTGAWIKGKKEGSTITFATKQPVSYNSQYKATTSVRWGNFDTEKFAAADDYADSFILDIKGDSLIMRGTQATTGSTATYFPGIFWDDDNSFGGYGDCGVTLIEKKPIVERDTVDVISAKMTYNDFIATDAAVQYYAGDDAGYAQFCVTSKDASSVFGTFDVWADYSWIQFTETTGIDIQEGKITVTEEEDGVHLTGYVIGNDEKYYRLNWFMEAGILPSDTDAPFEATFAYSDMSTDLDEGVIGIYATNAENLTIGLELYTDPTATEIPAGTYVISDTQEAGTALQSLGVVGGYLTECWAGVRGTSGISDCWFMVEGTITLSYDEYGKLKVVVDGKNSYGQPVTALVQYVKLEPKSTVDIVATDLTYTDEWYAKYGIQEFVLTNNNYGVLLDIFADTLVGEFTEDDVDLADSYIVDFNTGVKIPVVNTGDIVVTLDGKNLALTANLIGADTIQYNITATGYLGALPYDSKEDFEAAFAEEEAAIQQVAVSKVNYIYIVASNDESGKLALAVKGELTEEGAIAAGEYTEVLPCAGVNSDYSINPSYAMDADGAAWFIQSGKLTVYENGAMLFEGLNSYDKNVIVTVGEVPVTDFYLVGWINGAAYGIEGDIDNFGDYHFVAGEDGALKVKATFNEMSYVQVKDNNKQIYGTASYVAPAAEGTSAVVLATGTEKMGIDGGAEFEYTLTIAEDGTMTLSYAPTATGLNNIKANVKAAKRIANGQIVIVRDNKEYNILGAAL